MKKMRKGRGSETRKTKFMRKKKMRLKRRG